ncbi:hypothetical protein [Actinophytocola xanthii]|uniref:Uncharacterized protein n=1 Tax=Actinophytocola xanthii TaxID=1912961 RepID=A0A1Q8CTE4_9PSEU|nr:hypothetical protein [Actinophytocola xanthii]OLF17632.1 hypothetical protein BU204_10470 [Actinophytocola xanthii]
MTTPGKRSGFDESTLRVVIAATQEAVGGLTQVGSRVSYLASALPTVNISKSGGRLGEIFLKLSGDLKAIKDNLDFVNQKATGLLKHNINVDADADAKGR